MTWTTAVVGADGVARCPWASGDPMNMAYHDTEWGMPLLGTEAERERAYLERLTLEAFQSGLSWRTILAKRENFRAAFASFEPERVAAFTDSDRARLMADAGIVRNRLKVDAAIRNAQATVALREGGGLSALMDSYRQEDAIVPFVAAAVPTVTAESKALAKALKKAGFAFVGPTTMYALMEAVGLVDDHLGDCHRRGARHMADPPTY